MANSVLDGCGRYSEKLIEISKSIVEKRTINGEKTSKNDIWTIDSQIFEAYQTILATAKDSNVIAKSIEYLKESVEKSGSISDINSLAISSVQKSIVEEQRYTEIKEETSKVVENVATAVIITDVMKDGSLNNLDSFLNTEIVNNLDEEIEKAKNGDDEALGGIDAFKGAAEALGRYDKLDEKQTREVLARMMRMAAYDSPTNRKLLEQMANQYGFDILEKSENGEILISEEKLTDLYQSKLPSNSKTSVRTVNDFKEINMGKAKKARENGDIPENGTKIAGKVKNDSKEKKVRNALKLALEQGNEEAITELCEKYPKEVKEILKQKIDAINKSQELGKKITSKRHEDILKISNGIKVAKEQQKSNEPIKHDNAR